MSARHVNGWSEDARKAAVAKAARWTAEQAERLGYSPDEILAAIRRGWTAEEVEALPWLRLTGLCCPLRRRWPRS